MLLKNKVAIVTGGNTGIGKAIVLELAREGANIVVDYISHPEATEELEKQCAALGDQAIGVDADVSKIADLEKLVAAAVKTFGRLDIMVNNAGMETRTSILDTTEQQYEKVLEVNLKSAFFGTQLAARQMIKQKSGGRIINITSVHEDWPMPGNTPYCLSKGGMRMLTRTAAVELAPHNILVTGVGPGAVATPINLVDDAESGKDGKARCRHTSGKDGSASGDRERSRVSCRGRRQLRHSNNHLHRWRPHGKQPRVVAKEELKMPDNYDVIIIGSGAGGGTLARQLAPTGKRILILERGDWLKREALNWDTKAVFVDNRYVSPDTWYDDKGKAFQPQIHYFVGGATKFYGAALYRLRREDFGELREYDGISPAWPISYDDMEPFYTKAEQMYQVHGMHGVDPTEPPASAPYPHPPVSNEPRIQQLFSDLKAAGLHPFQAPCGIMLNEQNMAHSKCIRCQTCDGFPCLVQAKADAEMLGVRPALQLPNVTLLRNSKVLKLNTNANGTAVTEVVVERDGGIETFRGDIVVVSCGAANSAKLLLMSANDKHPKGLANGSDQVGRNYMFHNSTAVLALSKEPNPTFFQKTLALHDFYFGMEGFDYPVGSIQMVGKSAGEMYKGEKPLETKLAPIGMLDDIARHAVDFWLCTEDLPDPENRVALNKAGKHYAGVHA